MLPKDNVPNASKRQPFFRYSARNASCAPLLRVRHYAAQCAQCYKYRLLPTKEKFEEIRAHVIEEPFYCQTARDWRPDITCDDPEDISQDGNWLWAIDKANIPQPPPGWQRLLQFRGNRRTRFADVYYCAPSGKKLRSKVEIQKYFHEHPEDSNGVSLSQFSFQIPELLQNAHLRKQPAVVPGLYARGNDNFSNEAPMLLAGPDSQTHSQPESSRPSSPPADS